MKYFIGMTFNEDCSQIQSIKNFQERVDPFREKSMPLHVSLLPPFSAGHLRSELIEDIVDTLDGMFVGGLNNKHLLFESYDLFHKNNGLLFLNSKPFTNLIYAQECVYQLLKDEGVQFKKQKRPSKRDEDFFKPLMVLGKFYDQRALDLAHHLFKESIEIPLSATMGQIYLYEKIRNDWVIKEKLFSFETIEDKFIINRVLAY